jgi:hypothetical protein
LGKRAAESRYSEALTRTPTIEISTPTEMGKEKWSELVSQANKIIQIDKQNGSPGKRQRTRRSKEDSRANSRRIIYEEETGLTALDPNPFAIEEQPQFSASDPNGENPFFSESYSEIDPDLLSKLEFLISPDELC